MNDKTYTIPPNVTIRGSGELSPQRHAFLIIENAVRRFTADMWGVYLTTTGWEFSLTWADPVYRGMDGAPVLCSVRLLAHDGGLGMLVKRNSDIWEAGPDIRGMKPVAAAQAIVRWLDSELP